MKFIRTIILQLLIVIFFDNNSFSQVELSYFTANVVANNVTLRWGTTSEINNEGFNIERKKSDSSIWITRGFVVGNGTINDSQNYTFDDNGLEIGTYYYRLKQLDFNGMFEYYYLGNPVIITTIGINNEISSLSNFILFQNYPNPFNPVTVIRYSLIGNGLVTLKMYDILGKEVATLVNENQNAGSYSVTFNGVNLSSGIYFYKIEAGNFIQTRKMLLLK